MVSDGGKISLAKKKKITNVSPLINRKGRRLELVLQTHFLMSWQENLP